MKKTVIKLTKVRQVVFAVSLSVIILSGLLVVPTRVFAANGDALAEYALANNSFPEKITKGWDGNVWFIEKEALKVGRITPSGTVTEYNLPANSDPTDISRGSDGNIWVTLHDAASVARVSQSGNITLFDLPGGYTPLSILNYGGYLWIGTGDYGDPSVGAGVVKMTTSGTAVFLPTPQRVNDLVAGTDGRIWITQTNDYAAMELDGSNIESFSTPGYMSNFDSLTIGADCNVWGVGTSSNNFMRITPEGTPTIFDTPRSLSAVVGGTDGKMWFSSPEGIHGTIDLDGTNFTTMEGVSSGNALRGITIGNDGNLWVSVHDSIDDTSSIGKLALTASEDPDLNPAHCLPEDTWEAPAEEDPTNSLTVTDPVTDKQAILETSCGSLDDLTIKAESTPHADIAYNYPVGLMNFTASGCGEDGDTATFTQYYLGEYDSTNMTLRKYNTDTNTYTTIPDAEITDTTVDGQPALKVVYQITDGGTFDMDGQANGTIVDPAGPGTQVVNSPNTGLAPRY